MDSGVNDLCLLQDEKFDFNVSLSPASLKGDDDDDEVFVGPVSHKERCVSSVTSQFEECSSGGPRVSWSPLTGDLMEAVCQEAHRLANQLQSEEPRCEDPQTTTSTNTETSTVGDQFVQDPGAKLGLLGQNTRVLSPIKRQTFCVQDSPMKELPPAIQRHLLKGRSSSTASSTRPTATSRLSTSSPAARARALSRTSLRGRSTLAVAAVLPSRPVAPAASCSANKSKMEKSRLQPPSKTSGFLRQSPSICPSSRAESSEDLLSDSASVASDMSDSSINSSLLGKHTLAPPTKGVGVRNFCGVKALPPQSRRVTDRKNTSSSSSSVSSFNSSHSLSPAKGKLNSSLNQSLSSTGPAPSSISRPANQSRSRRSTAYTAAEAAASSTSRRSLSFHAKKLSEGERGGAIKPSPLKRPEATPLQPTPPKRLLQRTASLATVGSGRLQNGVKTKPKPETPVFTTPSSADGSKMLKPKRFMSTGSTDSLLQKPSAAPLTASVSSLKPLQGSSRRPSALPTPVKRRISAIPAPSSQTRTARSPSVAESNIRPTPSSAGKLHCCSPSFKEPHEDEPAQPPDIQPFCLEEEPPVVSSLPKPPEPSQTENTDPGGLTANEMAPTRNLMELETTDESTTKTQERLLLDLSPPALQAQEKLLIDLTNTPDLVRTNIKSCTTTQLIDLSSPLIKWSPEEKKNNSPLISLSF